MTRPMSPSAGGSGIASAAAAAASSSERRGPRRLRRGASGDLAHDQAVYDTAAEIPDLAAGTLEAALAIARARVGEGLMLAGVGSALGLVLAAWGLAFLRPFLPPDLLVGVGHEKELTPERAGAGRSPWRP